MSRRAEERLDAQVLLDPFEEQLDLPALAIQGADRRGGQGELIGEQHDGLAGVRVAQTQSPQHGGIASPCHIARQDDGLIARHDRSLRSEEHPSELQSLMRISYAVFCLKKKKQKQNKISIINIIMFLIIYET